MIIIITLTEGTKTFTLHLANHAIKANIIVKILWKIIPQPKEIILLNGIRDITLNRIITKYYAVDKSIGNVLGEIKFCQSNLSNNSFNIVLIVPAKPVFEKSCVFKNILPDELLGTEGYYLKVLSDSIFISANNTGIDTAKCRLKYSI